MIKSVHGWVVGVVATSLSFYIGAGALDQDRRTTDLRCTTLTVVDGEGRPRIVLNGSDPSAMVQVLDRAGTPRLRVAIDEPGAESLDDSAIRLTLLDHTNVPALELAEVGNSHHGRSMHLTLHAHDKNGRAQVIGMLGTEPLQQWPHLWLGGDLGGFLALGLTEYGEPELVMHRSPTRRGTDPFSPEKRDPADIGRFRLVPGSGVGNILVGDRAVVTVPSGK